MSEEKKIPEEPMELTPDQLEEAAGGLHRAADSRAILAEGLAAEILEEDLAHKDLGVGLASGLADKLAEPLTGGLADKQVGGKGVPKRRP